jgi:hypothetical protein
MKKFVVALAVVAGAAVFALPASGAPPAGVQNASFEQFFAHWNQDIPFGATQTIISGHAWWGTGTKYARLKADGDQSVSSINQFFWGNIGYKVTGWVRFNSAEGGPGSCTFDDQGFVTIDGQIVFFGSSCFTGSVPWHFYSHTLFWTGFHFIEAGVYNGGDDIVDSTLDLDAPLANLLSLP